MNDFDGIIDIVTHKNRTQIHIYKETEDGFIKILTVVSGERNALQVTKLTGSSKEKFLKKYKKREETLVVLGVLLSMKRTRTSLREQGTPLVFFPTIV